MGNFWQKFSAVVILVLLLVFSWASYKSVTKSRIGKMKKKIASLETESSIKSYALSIVPKEPKETREIILQATIQQFGESDPNSVGIILGYSPKVVKEDGEGEVPQDSNDVEVNESESKEEDK